jgi:hypothetical protein
MKPSRRAAGATVAGNRLGIILLLANRPRPALKIICS